MWISAEQRAHLVAFPLYFNGIDLTEWLIPGVDEGRGLLDRSIEILQVPGQYGGYVQEFIYPPRRIHQEVLIAADDAEELRKIIEHLNRILHTKEEAPIQFGDELDRTYYGFYAGVSTGFEQDGFYKATISFLCPKPFKYAEADNYAIENGMVTLNNGGTVEAPPTVKVTVAQPITYLDIFTDDAYKRIGRMVNESQSPIAEKTTILNNTMASVVGWTETDAVVDGGIKGGAIASNGFSFRATSFGTGADWHGPAIKTSLSEPLVDFEMEMEIVFLNPSISARGRLEWYLLDDQGEFVGKVAMKRTGGGAYGNRVEMRLGDANGHFMISTGGATGIEWRDFRGVLRISRKGNKWSGYVAKVDPVTKRHTSRAWGSFIDADYEYTRNLSQIQLHFGQVGTQPVADMFAGHVNVKRINPPAAGVPYIAEAGDTLELNFEQSVVYLNGEEIEVEEDFGGEYFDVPTGQSTLLVEPADKLDFAQSHVVLRERSL